MSFLGAESETPTASKIHYTVVRYAGDRCGTARVRVIGSPVSTG